MKKRILITVFFIFLFCISGCRSESTKADTSTESGTTADEIVLPKEEDDNIYSVILDVNGTAYSAKLYKNKTTVAFMSRLPITLDMSDLHSNEKYSYLDFSLPMNSEDIGRIRKGDIMLYGDNCLVLFYDSFDTSYRYTRLGYIENFDDIADVSDAGNITITFDLKG